MSLTHTSRDTYANYMIVTTVGTLARRPIMVIWCSIVVSRYKKRLSLWNGLGIARANLNLT